MDTYGKILLVAMPAFLIFVLIEKLYGVFKKNDTVRNMDMVSSLSSGITSVTKNILGLSVAIIGYSWLVDKIALLQVKNTFLTYAIAFLALDLAGYCVHRIQHSYNIFWNNHIVHHSSEEYNLACALRQSIAGFVNLFTFFLLPAALLGVPAQVIAVIAPLHLFAQFWYHTQHIKKMGFLEHIIVTPSHHRVHHAINPIYLDKNFAQIFIFWDKLFGTFQEELPDVPAVYGITRPAQTWNPVKINFQHLWLLTKDAWRAQKWKDKFRIWFMPLGWRPEDVAEKYPVNYIKDVFHFEKYNPKSSPALSAWCWFQLVVLLGVISYFFGNIAYINSLDSFFIYIYGAFVFLFVYSLTDLMDRNKSAIIFELLKIVLGFYIIYSQGDWFGISLYAQSIPFVLMNYLVLSTVLTAWLVYKNAREDRSEITNEEQLITLTS